MFEKGALGITRQLELFKLAIVTDTTQNERAVIFKALWCELCLCDGDAADALDGIKPELMGEVSRKMQGSSNDVGISYRRDLHCG